MLLANRMSSEFKKLTKRLEKLNMNVKEEMKRALKQEGEQVVADGKRNTPVNTEFLRENWYRNPIVEKRDAMEMEVGNSSEYAGFIENGFRSHFVPGVWEGNHFEYIKGYEDDGMYVGPKDGFVPGKYMLKKATRPSERRIYTRLKKRIERLERDLNGD